MKAFEHSTLGSQLKKQADTVEKQYQGLDKSDKKKEPVKIKKISAITEESKLMYDIKYSFSNYSNIGKYYALSFTTKFNKLLSFYHRLN